MASACTQLTIRLAEPQLIGREREYVLDCLNRGELSWRGAYVDRLEAAFATFARVQHAVACSSGTAALHLSLLALDVGPEDLVLLPALTYVATANAAAYTGAQLAFCDVDPDTWCLDVAEVERNIVAKVTAKNIPRRIVVIPVHLYGMPCDAGYLKMLQTRWPFVCVVEDAACAHGARVDDRPVGGLGNLGAFSFFGNKLLTCGEGGMVTTSDSSLAARARLFRGQGVDPSVGPYWHTVVGYNYRLTNVQAAIALGQLERYDDHAKRRADVATFYRHALHEFQVQGSSPLANSAHWMFTVLVPKGVNRNTVMIRLSERGIETRPVFVPVPMLPIPRYASTQPFPVSADIAERGVNLPTHGGLSPADLRYICESWNQVCK